MNCAVCLCFPPALLPPVVARRSAARKGPALAEASQGQTAGNYFSTVTFTQLAMPTYRGQIVKSFCIIQRSAWFEYGLICLLRGGIRKGALCWLVLLGSGPACHYLGPRHNTQYTVHTGSNYLNHNLSKNTSTHLGWLVLSWWVSQNARARIFGQPRGPNHH